MIFIIISVITVIRVLASFSRRLSRRLNLAVELLLHDSLPGCMLLFPSRIVIEISCSGKVC